MRDRSGRREQGPLVDRDPLDASAVAARGLTRRFGDVSALEDVSLDVPRGTVFGFLGPNGAGKTTTIRLLLGLMNPTSGTLDVLGEPLPQGGLRVRRRTGVVLENHGLYEGLTVGASLHFAARSYGLTRSDATVRVRELAERFGLAHRLTERPSTLSRGMRQRLSIVRALVGRPELLVLDEPTNGLDAQAAADLRAMLVDLVDDGATVFLTTHLLAEAERLCDLVTVIKAGRVVATGTPEDLRRQASVQRVRVEGPGMAQALARTSGAGLGDWFADGPNVVSIAVEGPQGIPAVVAALVAAGGSIHRVEPVGQTLEAAFLSLVATESDRIPADESPVIQMGAP
ncbi:MAG: ATP-binding cassette domain-containing protein [Nitriliruptorales bacterium]|nr:ATP-binding cassette domain-containing protein [Nitriliruptorales bacterium]